MTANQMARLRRRHRQARRKALGVEACFVTPTWTEITGGHWGDRWDISYGSGAINSDRMKRLWMTRTLRVEPQLFFVAEVAVPEAERLNGKTIGVCACCTHEFYLRGELTIPGVHAGLLRTPRSSIYDIETPGLLALTGQARRVPLRRAGGRRRSTRVRLCAR